MRIISGLCMVVLLAGCQQTTTRNIVVPDASVKMDQGTLPQEQAVAIVTKHLEDKETGMWKSSWSRADILVKTNQDLIRGHKQAK